MKKSLLFPTLLLITCFSTSLFGQSNENSKEPKNAIIEIGDGTTYGSEPEIYANWSNMYRNGRTQTLYLASELNGPFVITDLQWEFCDITPSSENYFLNVKIIIHETTDYTVEMGMFYETEGATTVFEADQFCPAIHEGWGNIIDIEDYAYSGHNNLIIEVYWGTNDYYTFNYFKTCQTSLGLRRTLIGYTDLDNPPHLPYYQGCSNMFSNIRFYTKDFDVGHICGTVTANGTTIWNATVEVGNVTTTTDENGFYSIKKLVPGETEVTCYKNSRNIIDTSVLIVADSTTCFDIDISRPYMQLNPEFLIDTLLPEEIYTEYVDIENNGLGNLTWEAEIIYQPSSKYKVTDIENRKEKNSKQNSVSELPIHISPCQNTVNSNRENSYPCPFGTLWSNPLFNADESFGRIPVYQQFSGITEPFSSITIYGISNYYNQHDSIVFEIFFYENGNLPGAYVSSYESVGKVTETGEISDSFRRFPIYSWTIDIPKNTMEEGYIRIFAKEENNYGWEWSNSQVGTGNSYYHEYCIWKLISPRAICIGDRSGRWLSLEEYEGEVSADSVQTIGVNYNAENTSFGDIYYADIVFSAIPEVSQVVVPVTMVIDYQTGLNEQDHELIVNMYPNPSSDFLTITSDSKIIEIIVINQLGKVVYTENANSEKFILTTESFPPGSYIVQIITDNGTCSRKIILSR